MPLLRNLSPPTHTENMKKIKLETQLREQYQKAAEDTKRVVELLENMEDLASRLYHPRTTLKQPREYAFLQEPDW
jgi:hypothetical protein